ncbi:hypothetical protein ACFL42_03835 [Candidatus Omnitrophota bacterium]
MNTFLFILLLFVLLGIATIGLKQARREIAFFIAVIAVTIMIILILYLFTTIFSRASVLFYIITLCAIVIIILAIASKIFRE